MKKKLALLLCTIFLWSYAYSMCVLAVCTRIPGLPAVPAVPGVPADDTQLTISDDDQVQPQPEEPAPPPRDQADLPPQPEVPPPPEEPAPMPQPEEPAQPEPQPMPQPAPQPEPVPELVTTTQPETPFISTTISWQPRVAYVGTTPSSRLDTCPCVLKPGTQECMGYDSRFMATTVEEAIMHFPDLQMTQVPSGAEHGPMDAGQAMPENYSQPIPPPPDAAPTATPTGSGGSIKVTVASLKGKKGPGAVGLCNNDAECAACAVVLLNRLSASGMMSPEEVENVSKKFGLDPSNRKIEQPNCTKYHFAQSSLEGYSLAGGGNASVENYTDPELMELVKKLQAKGEQLWRERQPNQTMGTNRHKRQGGISKIGQQYKIDCSKRGEPVEQGSNWVGLCNVCWAWRKLPSTYFPQYVNELVCDADTKCMSGFASCKQRYKSVDILQNTGTAAAPVWKQVTISVANYCDCEVESGSSLHNFVAA